MDLNATKETAAVILLPHNLWPLINSYRYKYNKNCRWPPHITLMFPFIPKRSFYKVKNDLESDEKVLGSFKVVLRRFDSNQHSKYVFLVPEGDDGRLTELRNIFCKKFPKCVNPKERWWPHSTIGKIDQTIQEKVLKELNENFEQIEFEVKRIYFLNTDAKSRKIKAEHFVKLTTEEY